MSKPAKLTNLAFREQQIVRGIMAGHTTKEVAYEIGISYKTAHVYLFNAYKKCEVNSFVELICKLYEFKEKVG